jgi:hypothetical protein
MRSETDEAITRLFAKTQNADKKVIDQVAEVTSARGIPRGPGGACLAPGKAGHHRTDRSSAPPSSTTSMTRSDRLP